MSEKLLNFVKKREENIEQKRRTFERLLFQNMLGAYTVIKENGEIFPISLLDISHDGCLFKIPKNGINEEHFDIDKEITLRMYFTKNSFVPAVVKIKYSKPVNEDDIPHFQYGCEFDKNLPSFEALKSFIEFLYKFAEHSTIDKDDKKRFFI